MKNKVISKVIASMLLCTILAYATPVFAYTKDETVYTKINEKGEMYKTIVSTHLENTDNEKIISDITNLLNIENTNGEEKFTRDGNKVIWEAEGKDIYYQGETEKELPVKCNISYELNGEKIEAKDIVGKDGNVKIILEYINNDEHIIKINNRDEKIYTPFVVVCGTIIDNTNNKNVNITNGKVINDGTKSIAFGIALPGMQDSLGIASDVVEIPNKIEITMETKNFECSNIISYVTPKIIEKEDLKMFDKLEEIYEKVNTLQTSSKQIEEGANNLKNGTNEYSEKSQEFNTAMKQVSNGVGNAYESYQTIDNGIATLNKSSKELNTGAKSISEGSEQISASLNFIAEKLGEAQSGSEELQAGIHVLAQQLNGVIGAISSSSSDKTTQISQITSMIQANTNKLTQIDSIVQTNTTEIGQIENMKQANITKINKLTEMNTKLQNVTATGNDVIQEQIMQNDELKRQLESDNSNLEGLKQKLANDNTTLTESKVILENNNNILNVTLQSLSMTDTSSIATMATKLEAGLVQLQTGAENLVGGISQIKAGSDILAQKTAELSAGAKNLYNGTTKLSSGTKTLSSGSTKMKQGLNTLDISTNQLENANNQLTEGAITIKDGANTLANGITTFNNQAITPICNYINSDVRRIVTRVEELQKLSDSYNTFTMTDENVTEASTKFIMMIDPIKSKEDK